MGVVDNVFFYVLIGLLGLYLASPWYSGKALGRRRLYGLVAVAVLAIGLCLLLMAFVLLPRLEVYDLIAYLAGFPILAVGLLLCLPAALQIRPATAPDVSGPSKTSGVCGILRHPIVLGEVLWPLGLSLSHEVRHRDISHRLLVLLPVYDYQGGRGTDGGGLWRAVSGIQEKRAGIHTFSERPEGKGRKGTID